MHYTPSSGKIALARSAALWLFDSFSQHAAERLLFQALKDFFPPVSGVLPQIIIWKRKGGINFNPGYFLPIYEVIYLIAKPKFRLAPKANAYGDVWEFTQEMNNPHPAAFPTDLINRIISSTTARTILDPFMGSGTVAVVARALKRDFIGIEISPQYCQMAEERLARNRLRSEVVASSQETLLPI